METYATRVYATAIPPGPASDYISSRFRIMYVNDVYIPYLKAVPVPTHSPVPIPAPNVIIII